MAQAIQVVEFSVSRPDVVGLIEDRSCYQLRADCGYCGIQKLCFWILGKIGAFKLNDRIELRRHFIDADTFMGKIFAQSVEFQQLMGQRPEELLIGAQDFAELMGGDEMRNQVAFHAEYHFAQRVYGLKVRVIPWMKGMLVMPKERE